MRLFALMLTTLLCAPLIAQDSESLNGSVPSDRRLTYLYEIDFGAGSSFTVSCGLQTGAGSGLTVRLIDLDTFAADGSAAPDGFDETAIAGTGTANTSLTGSYSGTHCFAVEIETTGGTTASDFNGSISTTAGTISFVEQDQVVLTQSGLKVSVGKFAFWNDSVPQNTTKSSSLELDFGSGGTFALRLEAFGTNIEKIEFIDTTGGTGNILATFSNPSAGDQTAVVLSHSGKATLRINVKASVGQAGTATWYVNAPCAISMSRVGVPDGGGSGSNDCTTGESGGWIMLIALLALGGVALRARRADATA